jgi:NAD(P)-dependent dehydrogenase (short-subunit alcohol dehydrogenase family)
MEIDLSGKVVCVTGAARRVGRAIALAFAQHGARLVIHHHASEAEAAEIAAAISQSGGEALVVQANMADPTSVAAMFAAIRAHYGRLDVMVNSAAIFKRTPFLDISVEEWHTVIDTNLTGPFLGTQYAARLMVDSGQGGSIINISDNSGLNPWKDRPHHSVSKAGVIMLTQVAALALADYGIRVNCVVPGPVLRPAGEAEAVLDGIARALPIGHIGNPEDVARAVIFLATNDFATGSIVRIDGGEGLAGGQT